MTNLDDADVGLTPPSAYAELAKAVSRLATVPKVSIIDSLTERTRQTQTSRLASPSPSQMLIPGPSPLIEAGTRTARNTDEMREHLAVLMDAARASLQKSELTETFAKRMALASFVVAVCSLVVAVVALFHA